MPSQFITIPLNDLLEALLPVNGSIDIKRSLPKDLALILSSFLENRLDYKIAFNDFDNIPLKYPTLWLYNFWYSDYERYLNAKARSEKDRIERWIKQSNIDNLTRGLMKTQGLEEKFARQTAVNLLNKGAGMEILQMFGMKKVITKEEEL